MNFNNQAMKHRHSGLVYYSPQHLWIVGPGNYIFVIVDFFVSHGSDFYIFHSAEKSYIAFHIFIHFFIIVSIVIYKILVF